MFYHTVNITTLLLSPDDDNHTFDNAFFSIYIYIMYNIQKLHIIQYNII